MSFRHPSAITGPRPRRPIAIAIVAIVAIMAGLLGSVLGSAHAQQVDLAPDQKGASAVEMLELRAAFDVMQKQLAEQKERSAELERKQSVLGESLAASNVEADANRKAYTELLLKLEGLGVDILDPDPSGLKSRLLKAVRDRDLLERELDTVTDRVFRLTEAFVSYMQTATSDDAVARQRIEEELLGMEKVFGAAANQEADSNAGGGRSIAEGKVVSLDPEIGLVVIDIGESSGVRIGMPIEIVRVNRPIGNALVVDVRDSICGALIHDLISSEDDAKIGDSIRPRTGDL